MFCRDCKYWNAGKCSKHTVNYTKQAHYSLACDLFKPPKTPPKPKEPEEPEEPKEPKDAE